MKQSIRHDDHGNAVVCYESGNFIDVYLHLKEEKRRHLGTVYIREKIFECKRKRKRHLHRKSKSYGFNHFLLKKTSHFTHVRLIEVGTKPANNKEYTIPVSVILEEGSYLFFLKMGFEKQIFLTLERIKQFA